MGVAVSIGQRTHNFKIFPGRTKANKPGQ